ncbi:hypothetical protein [Nostoc parmelioides]|uniref:Uncharacterized protein n=1 Tax=Nostoc parmelioides FACHB-3921 TaxID=2692909 RepID=A0ABR8BN20_9NOSO|nr:hypothetical protein [Nostoc parmelioides]MBD2255523.1 hypothetical protein [Nostoc parmelioides FACHB-3921]
MSTKIDANRDSREAAYKWQAFQVNPLLLMGCIVVPAFVGSYLYTSWQQTKTQQLSPVIEVQYLPFCHSERS